MADERSDDVFEEIAGYTKPPLAPMPDVGDYAAIARHGFIELTPASRRILDTALRAMGYPSFHAGLAGGVESLLRRTNMREGRLFAPVYSATVALEDDPRTPACLERAASLVVAARSLCDDVMSGRLPPDELRGSPLEMGQYPNLFSTSLVVEGGRGRLRKSGRFDRLGVVVLRRIYTLEIGAAGESSVARIAESLRAIVRDAEKGPPVGDDDALPVLTAADEKTLTRAFAAIEGSADGARALAALRDCFCVLCLDLDSSPADAAEAALLTQARNPANRWYMSSFQLVVFGNAKACGIFSFPANLDGNVMMRGAAELQRRGVAARLDSGESGDAALAFSPIKWSVDRAHIRRAWRDVRRVQDDQQATFVIGGVGRDTFHSAGVDPVSAFVVAVALATKRCAGLTPPILQLVTVSKYRCVPVGAANVMTAEMRRFVDHVERGGDDARGRELLVASLESQARECRAERNGLSLRWTIEGFVRTRRGLARARALGVLAGAAAALRAVGCLQTDRVILSHPEIYPELTLVGRPGVRLPYVTQHALHYQMFEGRTVVTFMPGLKWKTSNATLARLLEEALLEVARIARVVQVA